MLKYLAMPYYRITIWVKNKRKPLEGIRFIENYNIDVVHLMVKRTSLQKISDSNFIDLEVAMLAKNSSAVIRHLNSKRK